MTIQQIIESLEEDMIIAKNKFTKAEQKLVDKKKDEAIDKLPEL